MGRPARLAAEIPDIFRHGCRRAGKFRNDVVFFNFQRPTHPPQIGGVESAARGDHRRGCERILSGFRWEGKPALRRGLCLFRGRLRERECRSFAGRIPKRSLGTT